MKVALGPTSWGDGAVKDTYGRPSVGRDSQTGACAVGGGEERFG